MSQSKAGQSTSDLNKTNATLIEDHKNWVENFIN